MEKTLALPVDFCDYNKNTLSTPTHIIEYEYVGEETEYDDENDEDILIGYNQIARIFVNGEMYESKYLQDENDFFCRYCFHDEYVKLCKKANITPISLGY